MTTKKHHLALLAAAELAKDARAVSGVYPRRDETVGAIARTIRLEGERRARQRRARWRGAGALLAVAAAALAVLGSGALGSRALGSHSPTTTAATSPTEDKGVPAPAADGPAQLEVRGRVTHTRADQVAAPHAGLAERDVVAVDEGEATITYAQGSKVTLRNATAVRLDAIGSEMRLELRRGTIYAEVVPLTGAQRFIVRTSDETIEVHGTSFEVEASSADEGCAPGVRTRVRVREGVVSVQSRAGAALVRRGETWPESCGGGPAAAPRESAGAPTSPEVAPAAPRVAAPVRPPSDLAAQNDLYARATGQKKAGDASGAVASFEELLRRYPTSHLAHAARAERMRLLRGLDRERARAAAREYLSLHPGGFARADAETLLAAP